MAKKKRAPYHIGLLVVFVIDNFIGADTIM